MQTSAKAHNNKYMGKSRLFFVYLEGEPDQSQNLIGSQLDHEPSSEFFHEVLTSSRVRNPKFATYLKFATCENTKIYELW